MPTETYTIDDSGMMPKVPNLTGGLMSSVKKQEVDPNKYGSVNVADRLADITKQSSPLMQQAKTDALKLANSRGLINSSMAVGAAQDATVRSALPIASQDAATALQQRLQANDIASTEWMQGRQIESNQVMQLRDIASTEGMAAAERALRQKLQDETLSAADRQQLADIAFRSEQAGLDRALSETQQQRAITAQSAEAQLDRDLQERIAKLNLNSNDRNAAASILVNMEAAYNDQYAAIMANTNLSSDQREQQLTAAKNLRDTRINFVEQLFAVDLIWGEPDGTDTGTDTGTGTGGTGNDSGTGTPTGSGPGRSPRNR